MDAKPFLSAEWRNLLMANYEIDPACLQKHVPQFTELDTFDGRHFVSLVGFLFKDTKVNGWSFPFHKTFEEVNLRFYVRYKEDNEWKRGAVFIKEIVPKRMISVIANTFYGEHYVTHAMKHSWSQHEDKLQVAYYWKVKGEWNFLKAEAGIDTNIAKEGSEEEFITEHYWGYTSINASCSGEYEVKHPKWNIHPVHKYDIHCNVKTLYGSEFREALLQEPSSVFLAEGSRIEVMKGTKLRTYR